MALRYESMCSDTFLLRVMRGSMQSSRLLPCFPIGMPFQLQLESYLNTCVSAREQRLLA